MATVKNQGEMVSECDAELKLFPPSLIQVEKSRRDQALLPLGLNSISIPALAWRLADYR